MSIIRTITKNVITRAWHDIEPKLLAFLATGLTATALIAAADYVGIHLPDGLASLIVLIVGGIAGYIKSSTSKVVATPAPAISAPAYVDPTTPTGGAPLVGA
jgi:hypothetical protein